ncbi:AbrB/MazE/SpoVT family DNA-binding domain-containing protein [Paenibacillus sp. 1-18]|uniref:AbrB/MazE/SpoVT family DNA-binding domain-containing protein n=1 Tax=Paenibacillus sp. 1-18 TaxID=1333846 RepID=UPI000470CF19|nr:AbrB/MazE/SpoVT family DNA-binding domain-containing protein [Paenibacillus sp. 1-18]
MKNTGMTRPIDSLGRIVIPKEMRVAMDYDIGDSVEFFLDHDSGILGIRKYMGTTCKMCGSTENLSYFKDSFICESCIREMKEKPCLVQTQKQLPPERAFNLLNIRQPRQSKQEQLDKLEQLIQKQPDSTQFEYARLLGVAQSRISQLMKILREAKGTAKINM